MILTAMDKSVLRERAGGLPLCSTASRRHCSRGHAARERPLLIIIVTRTHVPEVTLFLPAFTGLMTFAGSLRADADSSRSTIDWGRTR